MKKYYFDTALFIYALEKKDEKSRNIIEGAIADGAVGTSSITIMEYDTGCFKRDRLDISKRFHSFIKEYGFEICAVDEAVAVKAAEIRAQYTAFKQMDSLQLACASIANADIFYTNDKQLKQFSSDETLQVVLIEEAMEI